MSVSRTALLSLMLLSSNAVLGKCAVSKPAWTVPLRDAYIGDTNEGIAQSGRSCGVAKWDDATVLIYYLSATKHLAVRSPAGHVEGGWSFAVQIVRTESGKIEQSTTIPAWSPQSELAVVAAGIVESDHDRLVFYSRSFKRLDSDFMYTPIQSLPGALSALPGLSDSERLYVTEDRNFFVLVDGGSRQSHFFVFDGATFEKQRDWVAPDVDWRSISIRKEGLLYTKLSNRSQVYWTTFDARLGTWQNLFGLLDPQICGFPVASNPRALLYTCGAVKIIDLKSSDVVYQPKKNEVVGLPTVISSDKRFAAILDYNYKGGGILDLTERTTRVGVLVVSLDPKHHVCKIPIVPVPRSLFAFQFAEDSMLVVLNDATVTAYKDPCPE